MDTTANVNATLRWNKFDGVLSTGLYQLLADRDLVDVTLACQGEFVKAHKNILAICSNFFKSLFKETPCQHPVVVLQGVSVAHIRSLLTFMYTGETTVPQAELSAFLNTAEVLQIKGLTNFNRERDNPLGSLGNLSSSDPYFMSPKRARHSDEAITDTPSNARAQEWVSNLEEAPPGLTEAINLIDEDIKEEPDGDLPGGFYYGNNTVSSSGNQQRSRSTTSAQGSVQPNERPSSSSNSKGDLAESSELMLDRILRLRPTTARSKECEAHCDALEDANVQARLPVNTMAELLQLEHDVGDNAALVTSLRRSLNRLGGRNKQEIAELIFAKVIGPELLEKSCPDVSQACTARTLSKLPYVCHLINVSVRQHPQCESFTQSQVLTMFKAWLSQKQPATTSPVNRKEPSSRRSSTTSQSTIDSLQGSAKLTSSGNNTYAKQYTSYRRSNPNSLRKSESRDKK